MPHKRETVRSTKQHQSGPIEPSSPLYCLLESIAQEIVKDLGKTSLQGRPSISQCEASPCENPSRNGLP